MARAKLPKLVLVTWLDPHCGSTGWQPYSEMAKEQPSTCYSVGFVVKRTRDLIILSPDWSADHGEDGPEGGSPLKIPMGIVQSIVTLKP